MNATHYQTRAARTLPGAMRPLTQEETQQLMIATGLAGETGELVDALKKMIFHGHGIDREKLAEEIGDLLWYVAALCTATGLELSDVMRRNVAKLERRYPNGFDSADSIARVDVSE